MDIEDELKDAVEMMGWGDFEIHPASTVMVGSDDGLVECEQPTFIQIKTGFRNRHLAKLKGAKLSVFLCIALHMDSKRRAFPSRKMIAQETGYSLGEVSRSVSELESLNMLTVRRERDKVNVYHVLQMARFGRGSDLKALPSITKSTTQGHKKHIEEEPIKKNQEEYLRAKKPRAVSPEMAEVERLIVIFLEEMATPFPKTLPQSAITKLWRNPMREIMALANGNSEWLLKRTIRYMREQKPNPLTIKNPNSLLGCAPDVWSKFRPEPESAYVDPMQPYWDYLAQKESENDAQSPNPG